MVTVARKGSRVGHGCARKVHARSPQEIAQARPVESNAFGGGGVDSALDPATIRPSRTGQDRVPAWFARASRRSSLMVHTSPRPSSLAPALTVVVLIGVLAWAGEHAAASTSEEKRPRRVTSAAASRLPHVGERAAQIALQAVGVPYRYGGESPASGFDCSGLVRWAYARLGVDLPHSSYALASQGRPVSSTRLRPGDILLFDGLGHVGLYLGAGRMVHAPQSGRTVEVVGLRRSAYASRIVGARRIVRA